MTPEQKEKLEQVARKLVEAYYNEDDPDYPTAQGVKSNWLQARIVTLLAAQRAKVLEEVAAAIVAQHRNGDSDRWLDLAEDFQLQAQEQRS